MGDLSSVMLKKHNAMLKGLLDDNIALQTAIARVIKTSKQFPTKSKARIIPHRTSTCCIPLSETTEQEGLITPDTQAKGKVPTEQLDDVSLIKSDPESGKKRPDKRYPKKVDNLKFELPTDITLDEEEA